MIKRQRKMMTEERKSARPNDNTMGKMPTDVLSQGRLGIVTWACLGTATWACVG